MALVILCVHYRVASKTLLVVTFTLLRFFGVFSKVKNVIFNVFALLHTFRRTLLPQNDPVVLTALLSNCSADFFT